MQFSYRKVNTRLRKMDRPEVDGISKLQYRHSIDEVIDEIVTACGFRRINSLQNITNKSTDESSGGDTQYGLRNGNEDTSSLEWNRRMRLYQRI